MKRVLITGSSGLIGSEAAENYDRKGLEVHSVDNNMRREFFGSKGDTLWNLARLKHITRNFTRHNLDIRDRKGVFELFEQYKFDLIIHCAAQPSHDRTGTTQIDSHYFFSLGWAMRRILINRPSIHVDIGSNNLFVNLLSAVVPVVFLDYRPLRLQLDGLNGVSGNILELPFATGSIESLSCLHVAEHIGLGRYGDPLDPNGTKKAVKEMERVLTPGGNLFLAVPVGQPRLCFNAHRIHGAEMIREIASRLELVEFSGVHDDGRFVERVSLFEFRDSHYACGMFWFRKTVSM